MLDSVFAWVCEQCGEVYFEEKEVDAIQDLIKSLGVDYYAMSNAVDLLPIAYKIQQPGVKIAKAVENEFKEYGEVELKLL